MVVDQTETNCQCARLLHLWSRNFVGVSYIIPVSCESPQADHAISLTMRSLTQMCLHVAGSLNRYLASKLQEGSRVSDLRGTTLPGPERKGVLVNSSNVHQQRRVLHQDQCY